MPPVLNSTPELPAMPKLQFVDVPKVTVSQETVQETVVPPVPATATSQTGGKKHGKKHVKKAVAKKSDAKKASKAPAKRSSRKQGGALIDDVKNLAVPFAILLAKQGLQSMFDKKKTTPDVPLAASTASKPLSARRRSTAVGGSCGSQCAAAIPQTQNGGRTRKTGGATSPVPATKVLRGGAVARALGTGTVRGGAPASAKHPSGGNRSEQVKSRFEKLSREIDAFLQKY